MYLKSDMGRRAASCWAVPHISSLFIYLYLNHLSLECCSRLPFVAQFLVLLLSSLAAGSRSSVAGEMLSGKHTLIVDS